MQEDVVHLKGDLGGLGVSVAFVVDRESQRGPFTWIKATVAVTFNLKDGNISNLKDRGVSLHGDVVLVDGIATGDVDHEFDVGLVGHLVGDGEAEGFVQVEGRVGVDVGEVGGTVGDGHVLRFGGEGH